MEEGNTIAGDVIAQVEQPKENQGLSKKTGLIFGVMLLILFGLGGLLLVLMVTGSNKSEEYKQIAINLINKIGESGENQIIYFYEDLKKLDPDFGTSPYGREISKSAFIFYQNGNPVTCFSDGEHMLTRGTYENKFTILDEKRDCDNLTSVGDPEKEDYFIYYYGKKGYTVEKENIKKVDERYFRIETDDIVIYTTFSIADHEIIIDDDLGYSETINNIDDAITAVGYYLKNIDGSGIGMNKGVNYINKMTSAAGQDYIHIRSNENYGGSLKLLYNISDYLIGRKCVDLIITMNSITMEGDKVYNAFAIRSIIKDGKFEIQTIENNEKKE